MASEWQSCVYIYQRILLFILSIHFYFCIRFLDFVVYILIWFNGKQASKLSSVSQQMLKAMNTNRKFLAIFLLSALSARTVPGEFCDNGTGECKELTATDCPVLFYNEYIIGANKIKYCDEFNDIVCCPLPLNAQKRVITQAEPIKLYEKGKKID